MERSNCRSRSIAMSYTSKIYDAFFGDKEGTVQYLDFILRYLKKGPILDCACGSGDLLLMLQEEMPADGLDLDKSMLEIARSKGVKGKLIQQDMKEEWNLTNKYGRIVCIGDSLNYLNSLEQVESFLIQVKKYLIPQGIFILDMHSLDRLSEFEEGYLEEAYIDDLEVSWQVTSYQNQLHHQFLFYDKEEYPTIEHIVQTVFNPKDIENILNKLSLKFTVKTDFDKEGYQKGEKYFYIIERGDL